MTLHIDSHVILDLTSKSKLFYNVLKSILIHVKLLLSVKRFRVILVQLYRALYKMLYIIIIIIIGPQFMLTLIHIQDGWLFCLAA